MALASLSEASPHTPASPAGSARVAGVGHGSLIHRQGDGIQEPKGTCVSGRVIAALLWREHRGMWVPALGRRETEAALVVSQRCCAGVCGNIAISLQMLDDESCCVNNTPPTLTEWDTSPVGRI